MPTLSQMEANRLNALKSTGPRTPEGKARSARNALKHGLCANDAVIPGEDPEEYEALVNSFMDELRPSGILELCQVRQMITAEWRLRRIDRLETGALKDRPVKRFEWREIHQEPIPLDDPIQLTALLNQIFGAEHSAGRVDRFQNYTRTYSRIFQRALRMLLELRKLRQLQAEVKAKAKPKTVETNPIPRKPLVNKGPEATGRPPIRPPTDAEHQQEVA